MLDREEILKRAYHECLTEMYAKSQPSVDYNQLLEDAKNGKIGKDDAVYERYYLSHEELKYILKKYTDAYNIKSHWVDDIELLERYIEEGGVKDKYIEAHTDEYGYHPGYRGYEDVDTLKNQIYKHLIDNKIDDKHLANGIYEVVKETIENCKHYYAFDREESSFQCSVVLGPSPSSNKDAVKAYWKEQGVDIEIQERNPLLLWEMDYYGDEFEEVMGEEYGKDWKTYWDKKLEEENKKS